MPHPDSSHHSELDSQVTLWLEKFDSGDEHAAQRLWDEYFEKLSQFANHRLPRYVRRSFDGEDVALSVFDSLCRGITAGKFPELSDRENLWALLMVITARKLARRIRNEQAQKRDARRTVGQLPNEDEPAAGFENIIGREPTPEFALCLSDETEHLLNLLRDDEIKKLAILKLEGASNQDAAANLRCGLRTVERRIALIRRIWSDHMDDVDP